MQKALELLLLHNGNSMQLMAVKKEIG